MHFSYLNLLWVSTTHQPSRRLLWTPVLSLLLPHSSDWNRYSCSSSTSFLGMVYNWTYRGEISSFTCGLRYLITHVTLDYGWSHLRYASFGKHHFLVISVDLLLCRFVRGPQCWWNHHTNHLLLLLLVERLIRISIVIVNCIVVVWVFVEVLHVPSLDVISRWLQYYRCSLLLLCLYSETTITNSIGLTCELFDILDCW